MANDLDNLIDSLQRQRTDMETEMNSTRDRDAADLVDKLEQLRKRSEEISHSVALTSFRNPV